MILTRINIVVAIPLLVQKESQVQDLGNLLLGFLFILNMEQI